MARPMPLDPPVTMAVLPVSSHGWPEEEAEDIATKIEVSEGASWWECV